MQFKRGTSAKGALNIGNPLINKHYALIDLLKHLGFKLIKEENYENYMDFDVIPIDTDDIYINQNTLGVYVIENKLLAVFTYNNLTENVDSRYYYRQKPQPVSFNEPEYYWTNILYSEIGTPEEQFEKFKMQACTKRLLHDI